MLSAHAQTGGGAILSHSDRVTVAPIPARAILMRDQQNPDLLVPPSTDHGTLPNLRFSFSDAHMRLEPGGWTRQVTQRELAVAKSIAGVNMRLNAGGVRELHWHKASGVGLHALWQGSRYGRRFRGALFRR